MTNLPNHDYHERLPALDEQGGPLLDRRLPRQRLAASCALTPRRGRMLASESADGGENADGPPNDHEINHTPPEPPRDYEFLITQTAFLEAMSYFCGRPPEAAGILFGPADQEPLVTRFIPDLVGQGSAVDFELHAPFLNHVLQELKPHGLTCQGIIHSHPAHVTRPSSGDLEYFRRLFARPANADATQLFVPIVCHGRLYPYVFHGERVVPATLVVV